MRVAVSFLVALMIGAAAFGQASPATYDVVVVGATPGGIAAAVTSARQGRHTALLEYRNHVGGLSASGLGKSDIVIAGAVGGIWDEFKQRILDTYVAKYGADSETVKACRNGTYYEPHVAEGVFREMIGEAGVDLFTGQRLMEAMRTGTRLTGVRMRDRQDESVHEYRATVFIDGTYEGDLLAFAGADYRLGREGRTDFGEAHAGVIYMDHDTRKLLPGTTGIGDDRLPAFTYRLCFTNDPANIVSVEKPDNYDRNRYTNYFLDLELGRLDTIVKALSIAAIPNGKFDVNMKPWPLGFPFAEENIGYIEADWDVREAMEKNLRDLTLGLVYFLQNDEAIDPAQRADARQYGLPKDEFTDTANFPWCLYVREGRRLKGAYTLTENDITYGPELQRANPHTDAIATGEFPIDAFPTRKYEPGHEAALEGYILMLGEYTRPYPIPYGCLIPEKVDGLIVPVAVSATHIAFSSVRLEPTWMSLGHAAGLAADLAISHECELREVPLETLQRKLIDDGQVLTYFDDLTQSSAEWAAVQYVGTKGFFDSYDARLDGPLDYATAARWIGCVLDHSAMADQLAPASAASSHQARLQFLGIAADAPIDWNAPIPAAELNQWLVATAKLMGVTSSPPAVVETDPVSRGAACMAFNLLFAAISS